MTSRLRHKIEIDSSIGGGSNLNESFVNVGTPLPALGDTKRDKGEFVPLWKQEVRDEQGRKRLHGAFTGGFSAGYFNSVGSKEGWTPSTFVSSRNARASKQQRAEDFMDDEDIEQMKEGRSLENNEGFRNEGFAGTREEIKSRGPEDFTSALSSMIQPARTSVGHTLLQKLGWRPGQGIGPRVSARKRKLQAQKLGLQLEEDDEIDAEQAGKHTFAPRDVKLLVYNPKDGAAGLGFVRGMREALPGIDGGPTLDDDPYSNATASTSAEGSRFAFDDDDDGDVIMMGSAASKPTPAFKSRMRPAPGAATGPLDKWHDGKPIPAGFTLDPKPVVTDKWFAMPDVPKGWSPKPSLLWENGRKRNQQTGQMGDESSRAGARKQLSAEQRGAALGEEARKKSVFDYMSQKDKERLEAFAAAVKAGQVPTPGAPPIARAVAPLPALPIPTSIEVPPLSPRTASAALKGFIPFGDDIDKQDRYKSYLSSQCLNTTTSNPTLLPDKPLIEQQRELNEFQKSGQMFKPMSFAMSNRFTSASATLALSDSKVSQSGLYVPDPNAVAAEADEVTKMEVELTPKQQAAKNGMYGTMTRTVNNFYPVKLLCKRFGVADPHPGGPEASAGAGGASGMGLPTELGAPLKTDISWTDKFIHVPGAEAVTNPDPETPNVTSSKPKSLAEVGLDEDENQGRDTLTYTKPSIDIFKAIFASDDEADSEDDDTEVPFVVPSKLGPKHSAADAVDDKPVDLASFKPVFKPRASETDRDKDKSKDKKKKKDKKRKGLLTFDMEDGEGGNEADEVAEKERKEKKRQRREEAAKVETKATAEDEEDEWVEKVVPDGQVASTVAPSQGRKSAADFM